MAASNALACANMVLGGLSVTRIFKAIEQKMKENSL